MKVAVLAVVLVMLCSMLVAAEITDPNFSVAGVQGISHQGSGACVSYKVISWQGAGLWVDAGAVVYGDPDIVDPFAGLSTNIKSLDRWTENSLSLNTRWGMGYLFRDEAVFVYAVATIRF